MADKTQSPSELDEYKFSESEVGEETSSIAEDSSSSSAASTTTTFWSRFRLGSIRWQRLIVPGVVILAIIVLYTISTLYSSHKTHMAEQQQVAAQNVTTPTQPVAASASAPPVVTAVPEPAAPLANDKQLEEFQQALEHNVKIVAAQVAQDTQELANLNDTVTTVQQAVTEVKQNIAQLTQTMEQTLAEIQKLKERKTKPKKRVEIPLVAYHIRAIVPGRAWLESSAGQSVSVRVGDKLPGYGEVKVIAPQQGMVVMANGAIIQYGENDF